MKLKETRKNLSAEKKGGKDKQTMKSKKLKTFQDQMTEFFLRDLEDTKKQHNLMQKT